MSTPKELSTEELDAIRQWHRGPGTEQFQVGEVITMLLDHVDHMREEEDFCYTLNGRLAKILNDTANVLKGPPDELALHSTHDVAKVAERIVGALRDLRREVRDLLKIHPEISQHSILCALQATSDALGETLDIPAFLRRGND